MLVEWDSDSSVSLIPTSRLKSKNGSWVTQIWPGGVYAGNVLEESGKGPNASGDMIESMHAN